MSIPLLYHKPPLSFVFSLLVFITMCTVVWLFLNSPIVQVWRYVSPPLPNSRFYFPLEFCTSILPFGTVSFIESKLFFILVIESEYRDANLRPFPLLFPLFTAYILPYAQFMKYSSRKTNSILPPIHLDN